jgi:hypothetical protein
MEVREDKVLKGGVYAAKLVNVEQKETAFGERLMWTFEIPSENTEVVGFTSKSPSTKAKAYQWATAIMGQIDPRIGWGSEDVIGGACTVMLDVAEDAQGVEKNKVVKVRPTRKKSKANSNPSDDRADSDRVPF